MKKVYIGFVAMIALLGIAILAIVINRKDCSDTVSDKKLASDLTSDTDSSSDNMASITFSDKINLRVAAASAKAGTSVTVAVSFDTITEKGVGCCNFSLEYDDTRIELLEITPGEIIDNANNLEYALADSGGKISFLFAGENENDVISRTGVFAYLKFMVYENAAKPDVALTIADEGSFGDAALNRVEAVFTDGKITVQ